MLFEPNGFAHRTGAPKDMNKVGFEMIIVQCQACAEAGLSEGVVMDQNIVDFQAFNLGLFWFILVYSGLF